MLPDLFKKSLKLPELEVRCARYLSKLPRSAGVRVDERRVDTRQRGGWFIEASKVELKAPIGLKVRVTIREDSSLMGQNVLAAPQQMTFPSLIQPYYSAVAPKTACGSE